MVEESNPTIGKGDIIVVDATAAKEESHVCCHCEKLRTYNDYHPNYERCDYERGDWCSGMSH